MAVFKAFKAFRPESSKQQLIPALPYDVMSSDEAREEVKDNPYSFLHIDKAEIDLPEGTDVYSPQVYEKARENLLSLEASGYLIQDKEPCFYIYRQIMDGRSQTGIVGCASIDDYKNNVIKKHEHTLPKKETDRINHITVCGAHTGPIFLTYRNSDFVNSLVADWENTHSPIYDFMSGGVRQIVWKIDDAETVASLSQAFAGIDSLYIADGHHRCASAYHVGEKKRLENPNYTGNEEFNFFLAVAFPDNELEIMDYNRVVKGLNGLSTEGFLSEISKGFEVEKQSSAFSPKKKHTFGMFLENEWYSLTASQDIINDFDPVERLDVSVLQEHILSPILGIENPKTDDRIDFIGGIRGLSELERRVKNGMTVAFSMYPTTVADLMAIADAGLIMPPKSTWFEPKLLSGLFIHHFD